MSLLNDFAKAQFQTAKDIIGEVAFIIGTGEAVDAVKAEARHDRESELNGFQRSQSLTIVVDGETFAKEYTDSITSYLGKFCTVGGDEWKIGDIEEGETFLTFNLISRSEVS